MIGGAARVGAVLAATAVLAGCAAGAPSGQDAPAGPPTSSAAPAPSPDEVVCVDYRDEGSAARSIAESASRTPVLPEAIALFLTTARMVAQTPGVADPDLGAAQVELVAAIDDLVVQATERVGPDGAVDPEAELLDAERILAAVTEVERLCGAG